MNKKELKSIIENQILPELTRVRKKMELLIDNGYSCNIFEVDKNIDFKDWHKYLTQEFKNNLYYMKNEKSEEAKEFMKKADICIKNFSDGKALIYPFETLKEEIREIADEANSRNCPDNMEEYFEQEAEALSEADSTLESIEINEYDDIINMIDEIIDDLEQAVKNFE